MTPALLAPQLTASQPANLPQARNVEEVRAEAREQALEFESVFLTTFVQQMFSGIETDGPFGGGHAEGIYRSMMAEEYATTIARSGGIGIADHVYAEILKAQHIDP